MKEFSRACSFNYSFMPREEELTGLLKTGVGKDGFHRISHPGSLIGLSPPFVEMRNGSVGTEVVVSLNQCKNIMGSPAPLGKQYELKHSMFLPKSLLSK